jgi:uncharacterized protein (DUF302 family)
MAPAPTVRRYELHPAEKSMNFDLPYAITCRLPACDVSAVRPRVEHALAAEGFGVLTTIDVQATLEKKIGARIAPYLILGACNPQLAHRAISAEPGIGLLLPCNVVLAQDGPDVVVSAASPGAMFAVAGASSSLEAVASEAESRIRRAMAAVARTPG